MKKININRLCFLIIWILKKIISWTIGSKYCTTSNFYLWAEINCRLVIQIYKVIVCDNFLIDTLLNTDVNVGYSTWKTLLSFKNRSYIDSLRSSETSVFPQSFVQPPRVFYVRWDTCLPNVFIQSEMPDMIFNFSVDRRSFFDVTLRQLRKLLLPWRSTQELKFWRFSWNLKVIALL